MSPERRKAFRGFFFGENMGSLQDAIGEAKTRESGEKLDSYVKRVFQAGRAGKRVLFDPPGVNPTEFRLEPLNNRETTDAMAAARNHVAGIIAIDSKGGRIEDTDLYDERLKLEILYRAVKRTDIPPTKHGIHYPAAMAPDEYCNLTSEQLTYLYRQWQLVCAEFSPTQAQRLAMVDIEKFCQQCAAAVEESGDGFLFLASLSWQEAITLVGTLGAQLNGFLALSQTDSSSLSSSESSPQTSENTTGSYSVSPSPSLAVLANEEARRIAIENSLPSLVVSLTDTEAEALALANALKTE